MITETLTDAFVTALPGALDDFETDEYRVALYQEDATLDADTAAYTADDEISGTGYTAGGFLLEVLPGMPQVDGAETVVGFEDIQADGLSVQPIIGGLIYNATKGYSVAVVGCASTIVPKGGRLIIRWNPAVEGRAPIRVRN